MNEYLLFIILIILIFIYIIINFNQERFTEKKPYLWMYWENKVKGIKKPSYLDLCLKTIYKHCSKDFKIRLLDENTIHKYLPNLRKDLDEKLNINQKTDYYRIRLLYEYGGVWMDIDTIVIKSLKPMLKKLKKYDYIGSGCHGEDHCRKFNYGYPYPSNGVLISRKKTKFMELCALHQDKILNNLTNKSNKYFELGRETLWKIISKLKKKGWDYYHYPSNCIERNSKGIKLINKKLISNEDIDKNCIDKYIYVPIYNTAPGFPKWFRNLTEDELLEGNMLISKLYRLSLK